MSFDGATFGQTSSLQWDPFISNISIGNPSLQSYGGSSDIVVPYYFDASPIVQGDPVIVNMMIGNTSISNITSGSTMITAGPSNSGDLELGAPSSLAGHNDELLITIQIEVAGAEIGKQESYHWSGT